MKKIEVMLFIMAMLGLLLVILTSGCVTKTPVTKQGYDLTNVFEGTNSQAITITVEGKVRAFFNCTTNKRVFSSIIITINDKEKIVRSCNGKERLIIQRNTGTYRIEVIPVHSMVGVTDATNWRLSIWEKK